MRRLAKGATVNDVVLAVCSGGLRRYLQYHDELPGQSLVAWAPINARPKRTGGRAAGGGTQFRAPGQDYRYRLEVDFLEAARGGRRSVTMPDGAQIDLKIPAGLQDGQTLRL